MENGTVTRDVALAGSALRGPHLSFVPRRISPHRRPMKISIVTPSFNGLRFLDRAARSILSQAGGFELEWLVIDGGSTDGTAEFLEGLGDPRLRWVSDGDRRQ